MKKIKMKDTILSHYQKVHEFKEMHFFTEPAYWGEDEEK